MVLTFHPRIYNLVRYLCLYLIQNLFYMIDCLKSDNIGRGKKLKGEKISSLDDGKATFCNENNFQILKLPICRSGVNFTNVLCADFTPIDLESIKNTVKSLVSFYAFGTYARKSCT